MISHSLRILIVPVLILLSVSSCQTYGVVAENDVYVQTPSAVNVNEDPNDMTSFNAYRAGREGRFNTQYNNPWRSSFFFGMSSPSIWGYNPFYDPFRPGVGFGNMYGSPYYGFHGMPHHWGYNPWGSPFGWGYPHGNFGWGYPNNGMHGWAGTGYGWYGNGWGGYGYSGYPPNGWGNNSGTTNGNGSSTPQNVFTGPRRSLSAQSGRSSSYPSTFQGLATNTPPKPLKTKLKASQNRLDNTPTKSSIHSKTSRKVSSGQFVKPSVTNRANAQASATVFDRSSRPSNVSNGVSRSPNAISTSRGTNNRTNNYHPSPGAVQRGTVSRSQVQRSSGFSSSPSRGTFQASPQNRGSQFSSPHRNGRPGSPSNSRMRTPNGISSPSRSSSPGINSRPSNSGFSNGSSRGSNGSSGVSRGSSGGRSSGSSSRGNR